MALYFFDVRDGDDFERDEVGLEMENIDAVKHEAARGLTEIALDVVPGSLRRLLAIEVRDGFGDVLKATLSFEAIILRPA